MDPPYEKAVGHPSREGGGPDEGWKRVKEQRASWHGDALPVVGAEEGRRGGRPLLLDTLPTLIRAASSRLGSETDGFLVR